jgi:hypothetical protein
MNIHILILFFLNFGISWFNAWSVGKCWCESKSVGGLARLTAWCGAVMAAVGFTWCALVVAFVINSRLPEGCKLPDKYAEGFFALGYLAIILPCIGSGIVITLQSWALAWKERNWANFGVAGWNTGADVYNVYSAIENIPDCITLLADIFKGGDDDDEDSDGRGRILLIMVVVALACICCGILLTAVIIYRTARKVSNEEMYRAQQFKPNYGKRTAKK